MSLIDDIRKERLAKIDLLTKAGMDVYPAESNRTHDNHTFLAMYETLEKNSETATLGGRVMSLRDQGGIIFADLFDGTDKVQILLKKDTMGDELFDLCVATVDVGDFIEVHGATFTTNRGMHSLLAEGWKMLAKSLRPIPDSWYGLKDEDERYRKRYLDMLLTPEVRDIARKRSVFWNSIRSFLLERGFIEVETPILDTKTGGAEARPFLSHHNALDIDVFLRISLELPLKKLVTGGLPRVFEIGRVFRNEGMSFEHAQDFTFIEFYASFMDSREGVPLLIDMYRKVAQDTFGTQQFLINGHEVDLSKEWPTLHYGELIKKEYGIDPLTVTREEVHTLLKKNSIPFDAAQTDVGRGVDLLWKRIRKTIAGPAVMIGMPVYLEPLAKKSKENPLLVDRFQLLIGGSELGKAFNELNDPQDQLERFTEQQKLRDAGDEEAQMADMDYVEAMEYGMPPMFGFGVSERLFSFLHGTSIREAQLFPLMRPREEETSPKTKEALVAVAVVNVEGLESWQVLNTVAHLSAELGVRGGKSLLYQDQLTTADGAHIPLNIQHAIVLKQTNSSQDLRELLAEGQSEKLHVAAFTKEMLETTNDKKIIAATQATVFEDITLHGVLVFGPKSAVERLTERFSRYS